jgi:hypothetical protein
MSMSPATAGAATVTLQAPYVAQDIGDQDEDGYIDVTDAGKHRRNELEVRVSNRAVLVVERGRPPLKARGGCRRRSAHVVICRATSPDNTVYVEAGPGDDTVRCKGGDISMYGGAGSDRLVSGSCSGSIAGGPGNDLLVGNSFPQELRGGGGDDRLIGGGGDDLLYGDGTSRGRGSDFIDGGPGKDTAAWDERSGGIRADLRRGLATSHGEHDGLMRVENLAGTTGRDVLAGDARPNRLDGAGGKDLLVGRGGNDLLDGGSGSPYYSDNDDDVPDHFRCGSGRDKIRYPGLVALPVGCERMEGAERELFGETIPVRPKPAGPHQVDVPVVCNAENETCRRRAVVKAGRREIGRSPMLTEPGRFIRVRLTAAAPRDGVVTIVVDGDDRDPPDSFDPGPYPYTFTWRLGCRGAPPGDVCRAGG